MLVSKIMTDNTKKIVLNDAEIFGEGANRACYLHPTNADLCVKIPKNNSESIKANLREIEYYKYYEKIGAQFNSVSLFVGERETNQGTGYIFELVRDYDGIISKPLRYYLDQKLYSDLLNQKLVELYYDLIINRIMVCDLNPKNIVVVKKSEVNVTLKLVDGIGNTDAIKVCDYSSLFFKMKMKRKFKRLFLKNGYSVSHL
jgi:hypothetical protein